MGGGSCDDGPESKLVPPVDAKLPKELKKSRPNDPSPERDESSATLLELLATPLELLAMPFELLATLSVALEWCPKECVLEP